MRSGNQIVLASSIKSNNLIGFNRKLNNNFAYK